MGVLQDKTDKVLMATSVVSACLALLVLYFTWNLLVGFVFSFIVPAGFLLGIACCLMIVVLLIASRAIVEVLLSYMEMKARPKEELQCGLYLKDAASWGGGKGPCTCPERFRGLYWLDGNVIAGKASPMQLVDFSYGEWNEETRTLEANSEQDGVYISLDNSLKTPEQNRKLMTMTHNGYTCEFDSSMRKAVMTQHVFGFTQPRAWYYMDFVDTKGDGSELRRRSYYPVLPKCAGPEFAGVAGLAKRVLSVVVGLLLGSNCPLAPLPEPALGETPEEEKHESYEYYTMRRLVNHLGEVDKKVLADFEKKLNPENGVKGYEAIKWSGTVTRGVRPAADPKKEA